MCVLRCVFFLWLAGVAQSGIAQGIPGQVDRDAQRLQERERERQREREENFRQSQQRPPAPDPVSPAVTPMRETGGCATIREVSIQGMARYAPDDFAASIAKLKGDCVSIADIDAALRSITNRYIGDGYVTSRAVLAPQDLGDGILEILVIEGQLEKIVSEPSAGRRGYSRGELASAFPGLRDELLNLRDLDQGVDQLARLGSAEPEIDIAPAELPGASTVIVHRKRIDAPLRGSIFFNNDGPASTGRIQSTAALEVDSPLGLGDVLSLYYSRTIGAKQDRGSNGYGALFSLGYGYTTLTLSAGRYNFKSVLQGFDQAFANTGVSTNGSLTLEQLLFRDGKTKLSASAGLSVLDTVNRIQGIRLSTSSYRLVSGSLDVRAQRRLGQGLASLGFSFKHGLDALGANAVDTGPGGPKLAFTKIEADFGYQSQLKLAHLPVTYSGLVRAAFALDPVFPAERLSLGGSSTVRGFRDDGIGGRRGVFTRQQLGVSLLSLFGNPETGSQTGLSGFVGYDAGAISPRRGDPFERGFLHASSLGLRASNKRLTGELTLSVPISAPAIVRRQDFEIFTSVRVLL